MDFNLGLLDFWGHLFDLPDFSGAICDRGNLYVVHHLSGCDDIDHVGVHTASDSRFKRRGDPGFKTKNLAR